MQMLYDSDAFVVVHMQANEPLEGEPSPRIVRHGFEIVDKRSNKEVYLDGSWAGVIEMTPDGRPVIDRRGNVTLCTMSGVGFGLSPAAGHAVSDLVLEGRCSFTDIDKLALSRFDEIEPDWREMRGWMPL